jgi:2-keto-4-pentenoate hydratase
MSYPTADFAADPRVERGMRAQLARRAQLLSAGEEPLGWKVGFGNAPALERYGTSAPMVGFLLRSGLVEHGAGVSVGGMAAPAVEAEVAAIMGEGGSIAALAPAFELADIDPPPEEVEAILAGNIFQRAVMLGQRVERASPDGLGATLVQNRAAPVEIEDTQAVTGEIVAIVRHVAELLEMFGEHLSPGDVVITGAVVPPIPVSPGDRFEYELHGLGSLSLELQE